MLNKSSLLVVIGLALVSTSPSVIDQNLNSLLAKKGKANIVVSFIEDTNEVLREASSIRFTSRGAKATYIKAGLEEFTELSQASALRILRSKCASFYSSWIANRIYIKDATLEIVSALANLPTVTEIREELVGAISNPDLRRQSALQVEWNVEKVEAPAVWNSGVNGSGTVVAVVDTGVRATHQRLSPTYRGNYAWLDPIYNTTVPTDHYGHGSFVTGNIAGALGLGVAPGASWVACVGCNEFGKCPESAVIKCGEWVSCPSPNCSQLVDVVSNSWGFIFGTEYNFYDSVINAYHANGIIPVFAAGNEGNCDTIDYPGSHKDVIAAGATDINDKLAYFSSRGPTSDNRVKPNIVAPGVDVLSAMNTNDTDLRVGSGTSVATPHIAGVVALLLSKDSQLNYTQIVTALYNTAVRDLPSVPTCGDTPPTEWPNNMYGYGRVSALKAINAISNNIPG